jgi:hypothetical protein
MTEDEFFLGKCKFENICENFEKKCVGCVWIPGNRLVSYLKLKTESNPQS